MILSRGSFTPRDQAQKGFVRPSETTEFQYKGREYDILDIPLPAIYDTYQQTKNPASRSVIGICVLHGAVPMFHVRAHHKACQ